MTFFVMALLTALGTLVLAVFAIVTARYARKAFLEQSREVTAIERQVSDQEKLTGQQAELLTVQGEQLELQQRQFKQENERRHQDQASRVFVWTETDTNPHVSQVQIVTNPGNYEVVIAHVANSSEQPVYDVRVSWRQGDVPWSEPDRRPVLMPGSSWDCMRSLPDNLPPESDLSKFSAVVIFRDRNQVWWRTRADGKFEELKPGEEPPHSW
jgi:hypothetical protein